MNRQQVDQTFDKLSPRRREVLERLLAGETEQEISESLSIAESTIRKNLQIIYKQFKVEALPGKREKRGELIKLFQKHKPELVKIVNDSVEENELIELTENCEEQIITPSAQAIPPPPLFPIPEISINQEQEPTNNYNPYKRGMWIPNSRCRKIWGRDDFSKELLYCLNNLQEAPILALCGSAGYGKTEVASQVARAALDNNLFADVLWIKARDTEFFDSSISQSQQDKSLSWSQFIHEIAHQLNGCSIERVRQQIKAEKRLIILDNAETAKIDDILGKLIEMLNPSRVLLTSRLKTNAPYIKLIEIQGLEETWSKQLLRDEAEYNNIPALLGASSEQFHRIHQLSCGAPLALHFIVGRALDEQTLEPVLFALEQASGDVEKFYKFSLKTAWDRISEVTKNILRYMGDSDASVTWEELSNIKKIQESDWNIARFELKRWYLIENEIDRKGNLRYNLHPWVRRSLRGELIDRWQQSLPELEEIMKWMLDL